MMASLGSSVRICELPDTLKCTKNKEGTRKITMPIVSYTTIYEFD